MPIEFVETDTALMENLVFGLNIFKEEKKEEINATYFLCSKDKCRT